MKKLMEKAGEDVCEAARHLPHSHSAGLLQPDWALVLDEEGRNHLYFVVETKGTDLLGELRDTESGEIHCAEQHFSTVTAGQESTARYLAPVASLSEVIASL